MFALLAHSVMLCSVAKLLDEFSCEYVLLFDIWLYEIYRCLIFFQFFYYLLSFLTSQICWQIVFYQ